MILGEWILYLGYDCCKSLFDCQVKSHILRFSYSTYILLTDLLMTMIARFGDYGFLHHCPQIGLKAILFFYFNIRLLGV